MFNVVETEKSESQKKVIVMSHGRTLRAKVTGSPEGNFLCVQD